MVRRSLQSTSSQVGGLSLLQQMQMRLAPTLSLGPVAKDENAEATPTAKEEPVAHPVGVATPPPPAHAGPATRNLQVPEPGVKAEQAAADEWTPSLWKALQDCLGGHAAQRAQPVTWQRHRQRLTISISGMSCALGRTCGWGR